VVSGDEVVVTPPEPRTVGKGRPKVEAGGKGERDGTGEEALSDSDSGNE
jgi:hypothetical protein